MSENLQHLNLVHLHKLNFHDLDTNINTTVKKQMNAMLHPQHPYVRIPNPTCIFHSRSYLLLSLIDAKQVKEEVRAWLGLLEAHNHINSVHKQPIPRVREIPSSAVLYCKV